MICDPWFRCQGFRRVDMSGIPYGFWFGWRPQPVPKRWYFEEIPFKWKIGFYWYPPWRLKNYQLADDDCSFAGWRIVPLWGQARITIE